MKNLTISEELITRPTTKAINVNYVPSLNKVQYFRIDPLTKIGDYLDKNGNAVKYSTLVRDIKDEIVGIYVGNHPDGSKLYIPANPSFNYDQVVRWCIDDAAPEDYSVKVMYHYSELDDRGMGGAGAYNGVEATAAIVEKATELNKTLDYFPAIKVCKDYTPGFKDGEWYLPAVNENGLVFKENKETILESFENFYERPFDWQLMSTSSLMAYGYPDPPAETGLWSSLAGSVESNVTKELLVVPFLKLS